MSAEALKAFAAVRPKLRRLLADANLPRNRRVSVEALNDVGRQLAYRYDPARRGYVDETVDQIAEALDMPRTKVLRALPALDAIGLWISERQGGSRDRYGSRRTPGPELCAAAHRLGLNLSTPQTRLDLGPELSAPVRSDTPELSAPVRSDTPELSAPVRSVRHGTQRTLHRNSAHFAPELSALVRSSLQFSNSPKDDDARDRSGASSSSFDDIVKLTARAIAYAAKGASYRTARGYLISTERNVRAERAGEINDCIAAGLDVTAAAQRIHGQRTWVELVLQDDARYDRAAGQ